MGVQIPFSFLKILDFKPLQTKVRVLPWQMKSTFIIKFSYHKMPRYAEKYEDLSTFPGIQFFQVFFGASITTRFLLLLKNRTSSV